jgi:hypothetical protein
MLGPAVIRPSQDRLRPCGAALPQGAEQPSRGRTHCRSSPRRWATAAASPRPATPSLARMLETWTLAVFSVMNNVSPICRLVRPSAINARTSVSRRVRPRDAAGEGARRLVAGPTGASSRRRLRLASSSTSCRSGVAPAQLLSGGLPGGRSRPAGGAPHRSAAPRPVEGERRRPRRAAPAAPTRRLPHAIARGPTPLRAGTALLGRAAGCTGRRGGGPAALRG